MHYADIIAALIKANSSASQIADELDVSRSAVSQVIHGDGTSFNIATKISAVTGIPLNKLWPDGRYARAPRESRTRRPASLRSVPSRSAVA